MGSKQEGPKRTVNEIYARNLDRDFHGLKDKLDRFNNGLNNENLSRASENLAKAREELQKFMNEKDIENG